jgi:ArsR family transcriptional regulator, virulence genes transcriptional regulator
MDSNERFEIYRLHAEFCKTLSDANRLLIITELSKSELSVSELTRRLGLHQSNVSKHLGLMREHGLVNVRREGSTIFYSLSDSRIYEAIRLLRAVQSNQLEKRSTLTQGNSETGSLNVK